MGALEGLRFLHQHNGDIVSYRIAQLALVAIQLSVLFIVLKSSFALRTSQYSQQFVLEHQAS
jgi:hypothetical protein